jgi:hypothetical protein
MSDARVVECPGCDGAGQTYYSVWEWEDRSRLCFHCNGAGVLEIECPLITLDDLEEIHEAVNASEETPYGPPTGPNP